ncbi:MAG: hypothetical protein WC960_06160 [Bacteroidales bacterium]
MKKILKPFLLFAAAVGLSLFFGCDKESTLLGDGNAPGGRTITVNVEKPTYVATKVSLAETESGNISLKWQEGDKLNFLFIVGDDVIDIVEDVPVTLPSGGSGSASFELNIPEGIEGNFTLGSFYNASFVQESGNTYITLPASSAGADIASLEDSFVLGGFTNATVGQHASLDLEVVGSIVGIWVENSSNSPIDITSLSIDGGSYNWLYNVNGLAKFDVVGDSFTPTDQGAALTLYSGSEVTVAAGEIQKFYATILPNDVPDLSKSLDVVINNSVTLEGALPAMEMVWGKYYKLKVIYSQDGEWHRTSLAVNKVETLPEDTNCHLINPPTQEGKTYRFKMPISRVNEFWGITNFSNKDFSNLNNIIEADTKWVADIVWKDVDVPGISGSQDVIMIDLVSGKNYGVGPNALLEFDVRYDPYEVSPGNGNAVIGIRKADENFQPIEGEGYLWSWHVWLSDYDGITYDVSDGKGFLIMDRNLGARGNIIGDPSTMGLLYQYGRKDPFVSCGYNDFKDALGNNTFYKTTIRGGSWSALKAYVDESGTVPFAVNNPDVFIVSQTRADDDGPYPEDWLIDPPGGNGSTGNLWQEGVKTIFDPCPKGYTVSRRYSYNGLTASNTPTYPAAAPRGRYHEDSGAWFPFQGYRVGTSGSPLYTGTQGFGLRTPQASYMTASSKPVYRNRIFLYAKTNFDTDYRSARAHAMGVRCMEWPADN